jgi:hypothetical protein
LKGFILGKLEKEFQTYFLKKAGHCHRSTSEPGEPDTQVVKGLKTFRVELKILKVGVSGNMKIKPLFKVTQPSWYLNFLSKGGEGLFVVFRLTKGYGLLEVTKDFCMNLNDIYYKHLLMHKSYQEFKTLDELLIVFK